MLNNISTPVVNYGDTLVILSSVENLPEGSSISWTTEGNGFLTEVSTDGTELHVTPTGKGSLIVTVQIINENGEIIKDTSGNEFSDSINIKSKAGFWQKLVSFFKNLFGINRLVY